MKFSYTPEHVCSKKFIIEFDADGKILDFEAQNGCYGNQQGMRLLMQGMTVGEVMERLEKAPICPVSKTSSCPRELYKAMSVLMNHLENNTFKEGNMTEQNAIYRCSECLGMVEVIHEGKPLVCCGKPMEKLEAVVDDSASQKHALSVSQGEGFSIVRVGGMGHPMKKDHSIEWIEIVCAAGNHQRKFLSPGEEPEAGFLPPVEHVIKARAYCNKHGLFIKKD